jgi:hypothetical protein
MCLQTWICFMPCRRHSPHSGGPVLSSLTLNIHQSLVLAQSPRTPAFNERQVAVGMLSPDGSIHPSGAPLRPMCRDIIACSPEATGLVWSCGESVSVIDEGIRQGNKLTRQTPRIWFLGNVLKCIFHPYLAPLGLLIRATLPRTCRLSPRGSGGSSVVNAIYAISLARLRWPYMQQAVTEFTHIKKKVTSPSAESTFPNMTTERWPCLGSNSWIKIRSDLEHIREEEVDRVCLIRIKHSRYE